MMTRKDGKPIYHIYVGIYTHLGAFPPQSKRNFPLFSVGQSNAMGNEQY